MNFRFDSKSTGIAARVVGGREGAVDVPVPRLPAPELRR